MKQTNTCMKLAMVLITAGVSMWAAPGAHAQTDSTSVRMLTLDDAIAIAMENSPQIRNVKISLEQSQYQLDAQNAALKSNFSLSLNPFSYSQGRSFNEAFSTWNKTENKSSSGSFNISQPIMATDATFSIRDNFSWRESYSELGGGKRTETYNNNVSLSLSQPLFTYNRTKIQLQQLEWSLEQAQSNYDMQLLNLERSITQAFYQLYNRKTSLEVAREELANQQQSLDIIQNKVDAGLSAPEELYQAELNLLSSEQSVQSAEESLANSLDSFKITLGISIFDEIDIQTEEELTINYIDIDLDTALNSALTYRRELRDREIAILRAVNTLTTTGAQNEFKGSLNLTYGISGTSDNAGDIYDAPDKDQSIGISFDIPLWDWGESEARMKNAELGLESSQYSYEDERNDIIIAVRQEYRNLNSLVAQIDIAKKQLENAQLTYDINLERYRNGDLTSMDLQLYQSQLSSRKTAVFQAQVNYELSIMNMKILTLWDFRKNEPVFNISTTN